MLYLLLNKLMPVQQALRQHARTDPDWVRAYVAQHESLLSPLSRREAMKHLGK
jgi:3-methyladenine DNA glycosylase AlkD